MFFEEIPQLNWHEPWYPPRRGCKHTMYGFSRWWQKTREGGYQPSWEEVAQKAASLDEFSKQAYERDQKLYEDDWSDDDDED